jgi:hypoxanthine phosphoribosyltransferase
LTTTPPPKIGKTVLTREQIQKRVGELARQINHEYAGKTLQVVGVLENGFMFMSDLVRLLEMPVICSFVRPESKNTLQFGGQGVEIFFTPEADVSGRHILIVEAIVQSGVTSDFLVRNFLARGAASVKLAALLDKQAERKVMLHPDYFGFLMDDAYVVGYGMGAPEVGRNLPYIAQIARE